jgi:hypothetical protein
MRLRVADVCEGKTGSSGDGLGLPTEWRVGMETLVNVPDLKNEIWLATRIAGKFSSEIFGGLTDVETRKNRMRRAITDRRLSDALVAKGVTFAAAFERLYREPLTTPEEIAC